MWVLLLSGLAAAACPPTPMLRDDDDRVVLYAQNLQFIVIGRERAARAALFDRYLHAGDGAAVDLLLLSEARQVDELVETVDDFCFYAQAADGGGVYRWVPATERRSPGGLVLGVRTRRTGRELPVTGVAGGAYRARPVTLAEGWLGRVAGFVKGWANVAVDGTRYVWTHTQSSYSTRPERGAGAGGVGRAGQFAELAGELRAGERPTLVTGDLNLLDGFHPASPDADARLASARQIDARTVRDFSSRTGIRFRADACRGGSYVGTIHTDELADSLFAGATFDRVGVNSAFDARFPEQNVRCEEVREGALRLSDHRGLRIELRDADGVAAPASW